MPAILVAMASGGLPGCAASPGTPSHTPIVRETPESLVKQAEALAHVGETIRAEQYFSAALEMGGSAEVILPKLVSVCVRAGRVRSAVSYAAPHLRQQPENVSLRYLMATLYAGLGELNRANRELEQILARNPEHVLALRLSGMLALERGDYITAEKRLQAFLLLEPTGPNASSVREELQQIQAAPASAAAVREEAL